MASSRTIRTVMTLLSLMLLSSSLKLAESSGYGLDRIPAARTGRKLLQDLESSPSDVPGLPDLPSVDELDVPSASDLDSPASVLDSVSDTANTARNVVNDAANPDVPDVPLPTVRLPIVPPLSDTLDVPTPPSPAEDDLGDDDAEDLLAPPALAPLAERDILAPSPAGTEIDIAAAVPSEDDAPTVAPEPAPTARVIQFQAVSPITAAGVPTTITAGSRPPYIPLQTADPTPETIPETGAIASPSPSPAEWWQVPPPPPPSPPAEGLPAGPEAGNAALAEAAQAPQAGAEWWQVPPPPPPSPPGASAPEEISSPSRPLVFQAAAGPAVTPAATSGPESWQVPPPPPPSPPSGAAGPTTALAQSPLPDAGSSGPAASGTEWWQVPPPPPPSSPADALAAQSPAQPEAAAGNAAAPSADWWKVPPPPPPSPPAGGIAPAGAATGRRLLGSAAGPEWLDSLADPTADSASGLVDADSPTSESSTLPAAADILSLPPLPARLSLATSPVADSLEQLQAPIGVPLPDPSLPADLPGALPPAVQRAADLPDSLDLNDPVTPAARNALTDLQSTAGSVAPAGPSDEVLDQVRQALP